MTATMPLLTNNRICLQLPLALLLFLLLDIKFTYSEYLRRNIPQEQQNDQPRMFLPGPHGHTLEPHTPHERHGHSHIDHPRVDVFQKRKKTHGPHHHFGDPHHDRQHHNGSIIIRVQEAVKMHNGSINVVLLGDSMLSHIQLNATQWTPFQYRYKVLNLGAPRDRSEHILFRLSNKDATNPIADVKYVVIMIGTNNVGVGDTVQTVFNGISSVVEKTASVFDRNTTILLLGLLPRPNNANITRIMTKINVKLSERYAPHPDVFFLNIFEKFVFKMSRIINREMFMPDNMHPNYKGYQALIDMLKPYLDGKVPRKTLQSVISTAMLTADKLPHLSVAMSMINGLKNLAASTASASASAPASLPA